MKNFTAFVEIVLICSLAFLFPIIYNMIFDATAKSHMYGYTVLLISDISMFVIFGGIRLYLRQK